MAEITTLPNPMVEILGERSGAFERLRKRVNQLDGLLTFVHQFHEDFDGSHLDYTLELAADTAFEIRELAELINDSTPPADESASMRRSYLQTIEAAEKLLNAVGGNWISDAVSEAQEDLEANIEAARDDFLGEKEVRS